MARVKANEELFGQNVLNDITIKPFTETLADDGAEIKTLSREAVDFILLVEQIQSLFTCYNNYYLIQIEDCMQDNFSIRELFKLGQRIVLGKINTLVNQALTLLSRTNFNSDEITTYYTNIVSQFTRLQ